MIVEHFFLRFQNSGYLQMKPSVKPCMGHRQPALQNTPLASDAMNTAAAASRDRRVELTSHVAGALVVCSVVVLASCATSKPGPRDAAPNSLAGTSWQLVKFEGDDGTKVAADDKSKYTITFVSGNEVSVRFDCNRGRGTWKSAEPGLIEFGPMAMTRAMCANPSLHDGLVKQWPSIRAYALRNDRLFLDLMADGGIYSFEPAQSAP